MANASMAVEILSIGSTRKFVLKTAWIISRPVCSKYAVMNEEPLEVMPPKKYTAMGVETVAAVSAIKKPVTTTFHQLLKKPALAHKPATSPMKKGGA